MLAGGLPRVLGLRVNSWCVPPAMCGGCAPLRSSDPLVALLSWVHRSSLWASGRQTWAGSSLADAGAPQLHALAPLQQRRWPARRPAHVSCPCLVVNLWAVLIKYTLQRCTGTLTTERQRMGKRAQVADDAWVVAITKHSSNSASSNYITRSTTWSC